jgi:hypothetical protein
VLALAPTVAVGQAPLPPDAVATVGETVITKTTYDRWRKVPRTNMTEVMQFLVQAEWVRGESRAWGIRVSPEAVQRAFRRQRKQAFHSPRDYRRFLRRQHLTHRQILLRVELDILQQRITRRWAATAAPVTREDIRRYIRNHPRALRELTPAGRRRKARRSLTATHQQRAITRSVRAFQLRWRGLTVCAEGYVIAECSNGPPDHSPLSETLTSSSASGLRA